MNNTLALPPRGTLRILGTLRPQANVLGISEQMQPQRCNVLGPPAYGYVPTLLYSNPQLWDNSNREHVQVL